jgi:phenylacetic acid degradation operon negative regulatory protein
MGVSPPRLSSSHLVEVGELFGISEGTVRVALTRMTQAGELTTSNGSYELTGALRERYDRQAESRSPIAEAWSGDWSMLVVRAAPRGASQRADLRHATRLLRHGELREGVWARPDNLAHGGASESWQVVADQCHAMAARPEDPVGLVRELFDLVGWADEASRLRAEMAPFVPRLVTGDASALRSAFTVAAAVVRHLLADPLLPADLSPPSFPAAALRADYDEYEAAFKALWRDFFSSR